ncbi:MAG: hypothetical protein ABL985_06545 [Casimicrobium sp.]
MKIVVECFASCDWSESPSVAVFQPDTALLARMRATRQAVESHELTSASFHLNALTVAWYWNGESREQFDAITGNALHVGGGKDAFWLQSRARFQDGYVSTRTIPFAAVFDAEPDATLYVVADGLTTEPDAIDQLNALVRDGQAA